MGCGEVKCFGLLLFSLYSGGVYAPDFKPVRDLQNQFPEAMDCCLLAVVGLSQELHDRRCVGYQQGPTPWHRFEQHGFSQTEMAQCLRLVHGWLELKTGPFQ